MGPVGAAVGRGDLDRLERDAFRALGERFPIAVVVLDPELHIVWTSPAGAAVLGHPDGGLEGVSIADLVHPDDLADVAPMVLGMLGQFAEALISPAAAARVEVPVRVRSAAGEWLPMTAAGRVLDDEGNLVAVVRPAAERHALDGVLDGLAHDVGLAEVLRSVADLLRAQFGVERAAVVHALDGGPPVVGDVAVLGTEHAEDVLSRCGSGGPGGHVLSADHQWVVPVLAADGGMLLGALVLDSPRPGGPNPYDLHVLERTAGLAALACTRILDRRDLERAATYDSLTGVLNRAAFEERLAGSGEDGGFPVALLYVDLDHFKAVNDELGHSAGDDLLALLTRRIAAAIRSEDVVGRLGGDEFAVLCPGLGPDGAAAARRRVQDAVSAPFAVAGRQLRVTASVGSAIAADRADLERLVASADADMYRRKRASPGRRRSAGPA